MNGKQSVPRSAILFLYNAKPINYSLLLRLLNRVSADDGGFINRSPGKYFDMNIYFCSDHGKIF